MEMKICKSCNEEKPVTQFNLTGNGEIRRNNCKACVSAYDKARFAKSGKSRTTSTPEVNKANVPVLSEIILKLEPQLRAKAFRYTSDPIEADDLYSAMVEDILTKSAPTDSTSRILGRAEWTASEYIQRTRTYNYRVEASEDDSLVFVGVTSAEDEIVERETSDAMKAVIAQLPADYQQVVGFLAIGLIQREIARKLEISEQAVSQKVKRIGAQMISLGFSPA